VFVIMFDLSLNLGLVVGVVVVMLVLTVLKLREFRDLRFFGRVEPEFFVGNWFYFLVVILLFLFGFLWVVDPARWFGWWAGFFVCALLFLIVVAEWFKLRKKLGVIDE